MSRRAAIVEDFDDDTDLPLPSRPLPNLGTRGAILESLDDEYDPEVEDSDDDDVRGGNGPMPSNARSQAGPASPSQPQFRGGATTTGSDGVVTDITPYKKWTCVYPIYIDAKRAYGTGERRVARSKSVWWPLSKDIAEATNRLGLGTLHEVNKSHPRDWENPGRVRVQWKKDGRLVNPAIKSKKQLLEMISMQIQILKPDNIPKPPYNFSATATPEPTPAVSKAAAKGKQPASKTAGKGTSTTTQTTIPSAPAKLTNSGRPIPNPPSPHPPLSNRVSPYSPALVSGVLIETVKAGMSAQEAGGMGGPGGGMGGKGKRKVIRVRQ